MLMKRLLSYILTVILLCGVTVSCNKNDEPVEPVQTETVIMFFPYSALESYINENIRMMKEAIVARKGLGNTRIMVYKASSDKSGLLFEILYNNNSCKDDYLSSLSATFDTYDQESNIVKLQTVFDRIKNHAPADKYSLIVGSHGNSWIQAGNYIGDMDVKSAKGTKPTAFGTASRGNQLDNSTLVAAAQASGLHFEYLLFDACYMASIEAAYDFRKICDYYIASQNEILAGGVPYNKVGDALLKHNYLGVVNGFYNYYSKYSSDGVLYPYGSLSVISTKHLDSMAEIVKKINTTALAKDTDLSMIQKQDGINPTIFFDFYDYYSKVCTDKALLSSLTSLLNELVPYEHHTPEFFCVFSTPDHLPVTTACGLDTSHPTVNPRAETLLRNTEWWKATN